MNPLGVKPPEEVRAALEGWVEVARGRAPALIVACNTASVRLAELPEISKWAADEGIRVYSMVDLLDSLLGRIGSALGGKRVCIMGTAFTVGRPLYGDRLKAAGVDEIVPLAATETESVIAHLAHGSPDGGERIRREVGDALGRVDTVLLACTCFPLAEPILRGLNPDLDLLDPGAGIDSVPGLEGRQGPNRMTVALTGSEISSSELERDFPVLFPGWVLEEVMDLDRAPQGK